MLAAGPYLWIFFAFEIGRSVLAIARPNIILFISDDQDIELGSMEYMPKALQIFRDGGAEFLNGMVTTPICCPSRSSILTGLYVHNHNVHSNNDNCTGSHWQSQFEPWTFATYLAKNGYKTAYFGKYLNEYNGSYVPAGWTEWMGLVKNSRFYNYTINYNGAKIKHGFDFERDYFTNLIVNDSLAFLKRELTSFSGHSVMLDKNINEDKYERPPVLMVMSFPAPHGPEDPAPQYSDLFYNVTSHRTPSWNYAPNPDKQWLLQRTGKMEPIHVSFTDFLQRRRLQTLQSIDDAVQRVYDELKMLGQLENTYMMYTSDHGYHLGQFGLVKGKSMPYDFDIRVPYFIRGPGIVPGARIKELVLNIDIAPTILDMATVEVPDSMDGRSVLNLLKYHWRKQYDRNLSRPTWRQTALIERGLRPKLVKLRERLLRQKEHFSKELRIQKECGRSDYKSPCKAGQYWECRRDDDDRWRIFKCRSELESFKLGTKNDCYCGTNAMRRRKRARNMPRFRNRRAVDGGDSQINLMNTSNQEDSWSVNHSEESDEVTKDASHLSQVSEEVLNQWESEFLDFVGQREVVNSSWFQGRFEAVEMHDATDADEFQDSGEEALYRTKRSRLFSDGSEQFERRKHNKKKRCKTAYANDPLNVRCIRRRYTSLDEWRVDVHKLNAEIRNLREKLRNKLDLRRKMKQGKPLEQAEEIDYATNDYLDFDFAPSGHSRVSTKNKSSRRCTCGKKAHPLKMTPNEVEYISYADLVAIAEERQKSRANQKSDQNRSRKRRRKNKKSNKNQFGNATLNERSFLGEQKRKFCSVPNLNCFTHDNDHWKTPPFWTLGPFCFCQNSNNNTYWCLRTINDTHDFLYCEFVTGFVSFYDMTKDKYQLHNVVYTLSYSVLEQLSAELDKLRRCKGAKECGKYDGSRRRRKRWTVHR